MCNVGKKSQNVENNRRVCAGLRFEKPIVDWDGFHDFHFVSSPLRCGVPIHARIKDAKRSGFLTELSEVFLAPSNTFVHFRFDVAAIHIASLLIVNAMYTICVVLVSPSSDLEFVKIHSRFWHTHYRFGFHEDKKKPQLSFLTEVPARARKIQFYSVCCCCCHDTCSCFTWS
jgi:hypothetical protein